MLTENQKEEIRSLKFCPTFILKRDVKNVEIDHEGRKILFSDLTANKVIAECIKEILNLNSKIHTVTCDQKLVNAELISIAFEGQNSVKLLVIMQEMEITLDLLVAIEKNTNLRRIYGSKGLIMNDEAINYYKNSEIICLGYFREYTPYLTLKTDRFKDTNNYINVIKPNLSLYNRLNINEMSDLEDVLNVAVTISELRIAIKNDEYSIIEICQLIEKINKTIGKYPNAIVIIATNKTYANIENLKTFDGASIYISYGSENIATLDEFINMRKAIDKIKNTVKQFDFSPLEQLIYIYDILKTFKYDETGDVWDSREIHKIFSTNKIVCMGYSRLLKQVLGELQLPCGSFQLSVKVSESDKLTENNHQRNIINLSDDKYGIKGIYTLDPTFDSTSENYSSEEMFTFFLNPLAETLNRSSFECVDGLAKLLLTREDISFDQMRDIILKTTGDESCEGNYRILFGEKLEQVFFLPDEESKKMAFKSIRNKIMKKRYLLDKKISLSQFTDALMNVKKHEGLKEDEINKFIIKMINSNMSRIKIAKEQLGHTLSFFN